jgi:putative membrane protein
MKEQIAKKNIYLPLIIGASLAVPAVVAILYLGPEMDFGIDLGFLPAVNATLNGLTSVMLILGFVAIRKKIFDIHQRFMSLAMVLSVLFLISYILYHSTSEPTVYGGEGFLKYVYYFLLISHIILAAAIVPLVLITYVRALSRRFDRHRVIAKITLPLWLYVSVTGFIVYMMISPYYK